MIKKPTRALFKIHFIQKFNFSEVFLRPHGWMEYGCMMTNSIELYEITHQNESQVDASHLTRIDLKLALFNTIVQPISKIGRVKNTISNKQSYLSTDWVKHYVIEDIYKKYYEFSKCRMKIKWNTSGNVKEDYCK